MIAAIAAAAPASPVLSLRFESARDGDPVPEVSDRLVLLSGRGEP
jgi:hypothetical protein